MDVPGKHDLMLEPSFSFLFECSKVLAVCSSALRLGFWCVWSCLMGKLFDHASVLGERRFLEDQSSQQKKQGTGTWGWAIARPPSTSWKRPRKPGLNSNVCLPACCRMVTLTWAKILREKKRSHPMDICVMMMMQIFLLSRAN